MPTPPAAANAAPTISSIASQTIDEGGATDALAFTIGDAETPADALTVSVSSSNGSMVAADGFEMTGSAYLTDGFQVSLNGSLTDTHLKDDTPALSGGKAGDALPFTPEWSASLNANYEWSVGAQAMAYIGGSLRHLSDQTASYDLAYRTAHGKQRTVESYDVFDLQTGVDFGRWTLELYGKNLTDADGKTSTGGIGSVPLGALPTGVIRPRTYGLTVGFNF